MKTNPPPLSRDEPFPCLRSFGLALISDMPESEREPFKRWLLRRNKYVPQSKRWPFNLAIPADYDPPIGLKDLCRTSDQQEWWIEKAFLHR